MHPLPLRRSIFGSPHKIVSYRLSSLLIRFHWSMGCMTVLWSDCCQHFLNVPINLFVHSLRHTSQMLFYWMCLSCRNIVSNKARPSNVLFIFGECVCMFLSIPQTLLRCSIVIPTPVLSYSSLRWLGTDSGIFDSLLTSWTFSILDTALKFAMWVPLKRVWSSLLKFRSLTGT